MYEHLKVTAYLQCGVVSDATLPLDGVLHYQATRESNGPQVLTRPGVDSQPRKVPHMWLWKHNPGPQWYYACSFAQWDAPIAGADHWNKRFDMGLSGLVDFNGKRGKVIVEAGTYKAYHMPIYYRHARSVSWYLRGDRGWVQRLLRCCTHLGKKTAQGWGAVARWTVEPHHADWSVYDDDGRLMRAIPADDGVLSGIRPSYWLPRNQVRCMMPRIS